MASSGPAWQQTPWDDPGEVEGLAISVVFASQVKLLQAAWLLALGQSVFTLRSEANKQTSVGTGQAVSLMAITITFRGPPGSKHFEMILEWW